VFSVILYIFRAEDSSELSDHFKAVLKWTGTQCLQFRKDLQLNGVIQKDLKFVIYAKLCKKDSPKVDLSVSDKLLVKKVTSSTNAQSQQLRRKCKSYYLCGHLPRSITQFDSILTEVIVFLRKDFSSKFASKKFTFLTQSGQLDKEDLKQEFMQFAIYSIYRAYPEIDNRLHMNNIAIQAIHNRGINIIKEQTSLSKSRLSKNADGTFSGIVISVSSGELNDLTFAYESGVGSGGSIVTCNQMMTGLEGYSVNGERPTNVDRERDLRLSVESVLGSLKEKPRRFVNILMGIHDPGFSSFLGFPNEELVDSLNSQEYLMRAKKFFRLSEQTTASLLESLKTKFADFNPVLTTQKEKLL
jgi:hypothetical protein